MFNLVELVQRFATAVSLFTWELLRDGVGGLLDNIWSWIKAHTTEWFDELSTRDIERYRKEGTVHPEIIEEFERIRDLPFPQDVGLQIVMVLRLSIARLWAWIQAMANLDAQQANEEIRPNLIEMGALARYAMIHPHQYAQVKTIFDKWGIPDMQQGMYLGALQQFPALGELLMLVNREILTDADAAQILAQNGFDTDTAWNLLELRRFWPSPQDIVTMAGREAFEEDAIERFNLDADMPEEMFEVASKAGMSREVMRWFWIAHWQNPSLNQVFEMIHRQAKKPNGQPMDLDDLEVFYRLADVQPFFGDLLRQIAYRPLTRVDVRRMFELGVLDREEVFKSYTDLGYDSVNAERMTQFTEQYSAAQDRELTRSQVEKLYRLRLLDALEFVDYLQILGYPEEQAYWIKDLIDADLEEDRLQSYLNRVETQYKRQEIDGLQAAEMLSEEGVKGKFIQEYLDEWYNERVTDRRLPSKEDVLNWYEGGTIDELVFRSKMRDLLFNDPDIDLYVQAGGARLSKTDLLRLFDRDLIEEDRFTSGLVELGYQERDVEALRAEVAERKARREKYAQTQTGSE